MKGREAHKGQGCLRAGSDGRQGCTPRAGQAGLQGGQGCMKGRAAAWKASRCLPAESGMRPASVGAGGWPACAGQRPSRLHCCGRWYPLASAHTSIPLLPPLPLCSCKPASHVEVPKGSHAKQCKDQGLLMRLKGETEPGDMMTETDCYGSVAPQGRELQAKAWHKDSGQSANLAAKIPGAS